MIAAPHADDARSFERTAWLAGAGVAVTAATLVALGALHASISSAALVVATIAGALALGICVVALAGGVIVLHRHRRELAGKPDLFWERLQRIERCPPRGLLRALLGPRLRAGTIVHVRAPLEIGATLDERGETDGIPFMPEMWHFCGRTFEIHRVIDKINDWDGRTATGLRRLERFVTLRAVRCTGSAHGGCQAECQVLWHGRWLARGPAPGGAAPPPDLAGTKRHVERVAHAAVRSAGPKPAYKCQITELVRASTPMRGWDVRQDLRPLFAGNVDLVAFAVCVLTTAFNFIQRLRGGSTYPSMPAQLPSGPTPTTTLGLKCGEHVVVLAKDRIGRTLYKNFNRGLWFGAETMRHCGQSLRVRGRIERMLDENTGELLLPKSPFVVLDAATATGEFLRFCPQNEYVYFREIWLERR